MHVYGTGPVYARNVRQEEEEDKQIEKHELEFRCSFKTISRFF